jgi:hypothetical protein
MLLEWPFSPQLMRYQWCALRKGMRGDFRDQPMPLSITLIQCAGADYGHPQVSESTTSLPSRPHLASHELPMPHLEQVYIWGSHVRYFFVPNMLRTYAQPQLAF